MDANIDLEASWTLLVSSTSGRGRAMRLAPSVERVLKNGGMNIRRHLCEPNEDIAELVYQVQGPVVALGGDGFLAQAAQGAIAEQKDLMILPGGRGNDFCRHLKLPMDPTMAAQLLLTGELRNIDVAGIKDARGNEKIVLGMVGAGLDSCANEIANSVPFIRGPLGYTWGLIRAIATMPAVDFVITTDGHTKAVRGWLGAVANGSTLGGGFQVCPLASVTDGLLDVVVVENIARHQVVKALPQLLTGKLLSHHSVTHIKAKKVVFSASRRAFADGDALSEGTVEIKVNPAMLRIVTPKD